MKSGNVIRGRPMHWSLLYWGVLRRFWVVFLERATKPLEGTWVDILRSRRDKAKLKWCYKLASMPENIYPKQLFSQEWNIKPRRGRQRKTWGRVVDDLFVALGIDKDEYLNEVEGGDSSAASFMASVDECISERECKLYDNSKVKLSLYRTFRKNVGFKKYLQGVSDAGSICCIRYR